MTSRELRKQFLDKVAGFLIDEYALVIRGESEFSTNDVTARKEAWELVRHIISGAQEIEKVSANSAADVMKMLKAGSISISEARELLSLFNVRDFVEESPEAFLRSVA